MPDRNQLVRALQQEALKLLVRREHSRLELQQKLQRQLAQMLSKPPTHPRQNDDAFAEPNAYALNAEDEFDLSAQNQLVDEVLDALNNKRWQSDARFAQQRITHRGNRYGNQRLKQELSQRGVDPDTISEALENGESELSRCHQVWLKKFGAPAADREGLAKQLRFLQYRGFSGETIRRVLKNDLSDLDNDEH